jgi:hypothetical protein
MAARLPWIQRTWTFNFPVEVFPDVIERLRGTAARLEEMLGSLSVEVLTRRENEGTWSMQENVGHLIEVEHLALSRLDAYLAGADVLPAADMSNRATHEADYNARPIAEVLSAFRGTRQSFVDRLEGLTDADFARVAQHPRLKIPMRVVDACVFFADHDDYHVARIRELQRLFGV